MSYLPGKSAVLDVNEWMAKFDHLVELIANIVARNPSDVMTQSTIDPQFNEEAAKGVVELGYRNVRHFCESFPAKFQVNKEVGFISLRDNTMTTHTNPAMSSNTPTAGQGQLRGKFTSKAETLRENIKRVVARNRPDARWPEPTVNPENTKAFIDAARDLGFRSVTDFCERNPEHFIVHQTGVITARTSPPVLNAFPGLIGQNVYLDPKTGAWLKDRTPGTMTDHTQAMKEFQALNLSETAKAPAKMEEKIHFKITHAGATRRFALTRGEEDLLSALKTRVLKITGTEDVALFWKDEDSLIVLESEDDLNAAVDFAQTQNKLACVVLETATEKKEEKEATADAKMVTSEESMAAFSGYAFMCDACDCYLAPSNGGRFKCTICDNYDLCAACLAKGEHENHAFVRLLNEETEIPLWNEVGGVLSTVTKDITRCTPTFVVKTGDRLKSADKVFIDVIDSVGKHVGKKMYDTAQWMKKEAEKMSQRREEAEVEEQKMVEEIIRREREMERKRAADDFLRAAKREEMQKKRDELVEEREHSMKDAENAAEELKAKLEQTVRDRRMAEEMWRAEKNKWKGARKHLKREEKQLRKSEKVIMKSQKEAAKHQERHEKKPEEKRETEEEQKEDKLQYTREEMMSLKEPTFNAPGSDNFVSMKEQQREAADVETSDSSDDSDVELIDKPVSEKNDSISSDLIMLDDDKQPTVEEAIPVPRQTAPRDIYAHEEMQARRAALRKLAEEKVATPTATPAEQPMQQQQPTRSSMYPELPREFATENPYAGFRSGDETRASNPWGPNRRDASGWGDRREDGFGSFARGGPTRASEGFRRDDRRDGGWGAASRSGGWGDNRRDSDRDVRDRGFAGRRVDDDLERQASQSRAERETRWRSAATRSGDRTESELFAKAARIPALIEISVLTELKDQGPEEVRRKLAEYIAHLENNAYSRERHPTVLSDDQRFDNELIRTVAGNLMKRLRSMQKIVQYATALDCPRMIENRIHELTNILKSEENLVDDERQAAMLREILLTSTYTTPRYGFGPFGAFPQPPENFGQNLSSFMDQSRASLSNYLAGFMPMGPPPGVFNPRSSRATAAAAEAAARQTSDAAATQARRTADAAAAHAAAAAADAFAAGSAAGESAAAAASAPAEEKPDTTPLTEEQQKVLRELFATGMFDDYDKMIKVCRRATDLHEAIDMMLD